MSRGGSAAGDEAGDDESDAGEDEGEAGESEVEEDDEVLELPDATPGPVPQLTTWSSSPPRRRFNLQPIDQIFTPIGRSIAPQLRWQHHMWTPSPRTPWKPLAHS